MPLESLACPRCGSSDFQVVKSDTYFCNHCENVFKYVESDRPTGAVGCESVVNGQRCGVQAVGRCLTDGRAFCASHGTAGECSSCRLDRDAELASELARKRAEQQASDAASAAQKEKQAVQMKLVLQALRDRGIRPDSIVYTRSKSPFRRNQVYGWSVGFFRWWNYFTWGAGGYGGREMYRGTVETFITQDGELVPRGDPDEYREGGLWDHDPYCQDHDKALEAAAKKMLSVAQKYGIKVS